MGQSGYFAERPGNQVAIGGTNKIKTITPMPMNRNGIDDLKT